MRWHTAHNRRRKADEQRRSRVSILAKKYLFHRSYGGAEQSFRRHNRAMRNLSRSMRELGEAMSKATAQMNILLGEVGKLHGRKN